MLPQAQALYDKWKSVSYYEDELILTKTDAFSFLDDCRKAQIGIIGVDLWHDKNGDGRLSEVPAILPFHYGHAGWIAESIQTAEHVLKTFNRFEFERMLFVLDEEDKYPDPTVQRQSSISP